MNGLDIFTGSGVGSLTLKHTIPSYRTCCYVENDSYCQAVLITRIKDGLLNDAPIWDDIRTFDGRKWHGKVDIIFGGFPCQPFSVAGQRKGSADKRNLWPDTARIIGEVRPRYVFAENVPGLLSSGYFETILCDLAKIGYDVEWDIVSAAFVGAPHLRKRLWVLAWDSNGGHGDKRSVSRMAERKETKPTRSRNDVADTEHSGRNAAEISRSSASRSNGESKRAISTSESQGLCGKQADVAYADRTRQPQPQGFEQDEWQRLGNGGQDVADTTINGGQVLFGDLGKKTRQTSKKGCEFTEGAINSGQDVADPTNTGLEGSEPESQVSGKRGGLSAECSWWSKDPAEGSAKSGMGRVANGISNRVERLKMLGNGWVPQVVARILRWSDTE